jgi:hypothetical protein
MDIPSSYFDPVRAEQPKAAAPTTDARYFEPEYIIRRRILVLLGSALDICDSYGFRVLFCHGKPFRLKEDMRVYDDDRRGLELLMIRARQWLDFSAAYDVTDSFTGEHVGTVKRNGWRSMLRDKWEFYGPDGIILGTLEEDSWLLALLRRFLSDLIPQSYDIVDVNGALLGEAKQFFNPFLYKLRLLLYGDPRQSTIDRRLILAAGMLLATIEGRQES